MAERHIVCSRAVGARTNVGAGSRTRRSILAATAALLCAAAGRAENLKHAIPQPVGRSIRWLAFYGAVADESALAKYDVVVLDPAFQGSVGLIAENGARVCSYLSLGEIRDSDPFFKSLDSGARLSENRDWPGTYRIDVRDPSWLSILVDQQIPSLAARGFTGLMLDTLDTPPYLELLDPVRFRGMREAAIELVRSLRARWPDMMLIMNRGYALLPDLIDTIDAVVAESLLTAPVGDKGTLGWLDPAQVDAQLALLGPARRQQPPVPVLSLDYWDPADTATIAKIYGRERALGHHPYVATRLLDQIVPEEN